MNISMETRNAVLESAEARLKGGRTTLAMVKMMNSLMGDEDSAKIMPTLEKSVELSEKAVRLLKQEGGLELLDFMKLTAELQTVDKELEDIMAEIKRPKTDDGEEGGLMC